MKKRKKFKPYKIYVKDPKEVFGKHRQTLSIYIINAIDYALRYELESIDFATIVVEDFASITLEIFRDDFITTLDSNIKIMEEFEEYEMCALASVLKDSINEMPSPYADTIIKKPKKPVIKRKQKRK